MFRAEPDRRLGDPGRSVPALVLSALLAIPAGAQPPTGSGPSRSTSTDKTPLFRDVTATSGVAFVHRGRRDGSLLLPEITGSGLALLDYDRDGDLDLYLVQSGDLHAAANERSGTGDRLYRNDGFDDEALRFEDVTASSELASWGFGMGVATGDFDNDGWTDVYVTNLGPNALLRNENGRFRDVTAESGADDDRWSVAASFADFDGDGWLDLYVVNYLVWSASDPAECYAPSTRRDYCGPTAYPPAADRFLRNRGDGTFEKIATGALAAAPGPGLGAVAADFDGDGRLDVFVANDGAANQLWLQQDGLRFVDDALLAGVAVNGSGLPEASMGIALTDRDHDGRLDLFLTHLSAESNTLYRSHQDGVYEDVTVTSALGPPSLPLTGFGTDWLDADGDGRLDLVVVNGAVRLHDAAGGLGQANQLLLSGPDGRFAEASASMPASFLAPETSRGLAVGDLDDDGDADFVVSNNSGPPRLYLRDGATANAVGLRLTTRPGDTARDALGATVTLRFANGEQRFGRAHTDGSYASARDARVLFSLPPGLEPQHVREVVVVWPDGSREQRSWQDLAADGDASNRYRTVEQRRSRP